MSVITIAIARPRAHLPVVHRMMSTDGFARSPTLAQLIEDLANRMASALEEVMGCAKAKTKDEEAGHAFHGNQWTGGISGPKPTTIEGKNAKTKLRNLLETGHAFTKQELMAIAGITKDSTFSSWMSFLKNPKYCGKKGMMEIVKNKDGSYQAQIKGADLEAGLEEAEKALAGQPDNLTALLTGLKPALPPHLAKLAAKMEGPSATVTEIPVPGITEEIPDDLNIDPPAPVGLSHGEISAAIKGMPKPTAPNAKATVAKAEAYAQAGDLEGLGDLVNKYSKLEHSPKTKGIVNKLYHSTFEKQQGTKPAGAPAHAKAAAAPIPPASTIAAPAPELATPGSIATEQANKTYAEKIKDIQGDLVGALDHAPANGVAKDEFIITHLLKFKNGKASAMAKWAHDVHGTAFAPKTQELFQADYHLAKALMTCTHPTLKEAAFTDWKTNTALEKQGKFPKAAKKVMPSSPATPAVKVAELVGKPEDVPSVPYASLIPKGFQPISPDDLSKPKGFQHGISALKSFLADHGLMSAQANKKSVEHKLRERLKDKPNFQALVSRLGLVKDGQGSLESKLIASWAGSSGDSNETSVALQLAVRDAFNIPDGHIEKKALTALQKHSSEDKVTIQGILRLNSNMKALKPSEVPVAKAALREFVQAQYAETQDMLKAGGHDHLYLARGMKMVANHDPNEGPAALRLQPASSFSANYSTAKHFAGSGGTVFITKVPRQQVLSTYVTGFGCSNEHEVVVLAHADMKAFTVNSQVAASHTEAAAMVKSKLKKG